MSARAVRVVQITGDAGDRSRSPGVAFVLTGQFDDRAAENE
jgi:hypothetical protein